MNFEYIDIHSHLNFPQYDADREVVIGGLKDDRIATITVGTDLVTSTEAVALADTYEHLYATIGVHPDDDSKQGFDEKEFEVLVSNPKVVAIGECGLDYARLPEVPAQAEGVKAIQKDIFIKQIEFAVKYDKPLMIHCRDAYPDTLEILIAKKGNMATSLERIFIFLLSLLKLPRRFLILVSPSRLPGLSPLCHSTPSLFHMFLSTK